MPLSIVIHHYLVSTDLNKQSGVVNCTNLEGILCLPGIIIHYINTEIGSLRVDWLICLLIHACADNGWHTLTSYGIPRCVQCNHGGVAHRSRIEGWGK